MKNIKKLKAWKQLQAQGFQTTTFRFRNVIVGYGAALYEGQRILIDIRVSGASGKTWEVVVDPALIPEAGQFTLNRDTCKGGKILSTIERIKAGKVRIKTRTDPQRGEVPVYAPHTYPG